jgi:hypothetical protein
MRASTVDLRPATGSCLLALLAACGSPAARVDEPRPTGPATDTAGDVGGQTAGETPAAAEAGAQADVPLPGPPGADPTGYEVLELPPGTELSRALWRIDGPLAADAVRGPIVQGLGEAAACLRETAPGGRLPLHVIVAASGRVVEVGGPFAGEALAPTITCAQEALRLLRFPESAGETTVRLVLER